VSAKARVPGENSFNACTSARVYYVRLTCVLRNGKTRVGYTQVCRRAGGTADTRSFHGEINSGLSALHRDDETTDYSLCVHASANVLVYSRDSAFGLSDSRRSDHRISQSSLPPPPPSPLAVTIRDSHFSHDR
jgi:hypothetical protein